MKFFIDSGIGMETHLTNPPKPNFKKITKQEKKKQLEFIKKHPAELIYPVLRSLPLGYR